jgi:vancomycin resistance protein YoaR
MTQTKTTAPRERTTKRVISLGRVLAGGLACLPLLLFALGFARFSMGQKALGGVTIAGLAVAGAEGPEVEHKLAEHARGLAHRKLEVRIAAKRSTVAFTELGIEIAVRESAARALGVGRSAGTLPNAVRYLRSLWLVDPQPAVLRVDQAKLEASITKLETALIDDPPFAGGLGVEAGRLKPQPPRAGRKLARAAARQALTQAVALGGSSVTLSTETHSPTLAPGSLERASALVERLLRTTITLQTGNRVLRIEPAELGPLVSSEVRGQELQLVLDRTRLDAWLAGRRASLEKPARDAGFEVSAKDEIRVIPSETGLTLVTEDVATALLQAAQQGDARGELPLRPEPLPARSTERAQQLGIVRLVGSFTTRHPCCQKRVDNIHRIASLVDGLVVEPGQTVSLNEVVGPRTHKNGFVLAPGIEDGEMVDTMGGGVSQFATTFFNALFHAGYDIIERQPHSYWFPRYPMAHEATLSWPKPDIIFKNDSAAGLLVKTSFTKTSITVKLYGDTGGRKVTSKVSERRDIVKPPVELLPNRDILPDEEEVKEGGMIGWSVIASRTVTFADGTKKEEKRKVTYRPRPRRLEVHPCRIPDGEPGATGERCPEPPDVEEPAEPAVEASSH